MRVCTSFFLHNAQGQLLLGLRHYAKAESPKGPVWTTAGGANNPGERLLEGMLRELYEETGITEVEVGRFVGECPGAKRGDMLYIFGGTTAQEPQLMEPDKFSEWRWWEPKEVLARSNKFIRNPDFVFINPAALELYERNYSRPYYQLPT